MGPNISDELSGPPPDTFLSVSFPDLFKDSSQSLVRGTGWGWGRGPEARAELTVGHRLWGLKKEAGGGRSDCNLGREGGGR